MMNESRTTVSGSALRSAVAAVAVAAFSLPAMAANYTFDPLTLGTGSNGSGTWDNSTFNWSNGTTDVTWANSLANTATIGVTGGTGALTVTLGNAITAGGIAFGPTAANYTITPGGFGITLGSAGISSTASAVQTIAAPITLTANTTANIASSSVALSGPIGGSGFGVTKTGAGTLILAGVNTYDGGTTLNGGTVSVQVGSAVPNPTPGTGSITGAFGTGSITVAGNSTIANNGFGVANNISINGGSTLTLTGVAGTAGTGGGGGVYANVYSGSITGGGTLQANSYALLTGFNEYTGGTNVNGFLLGVNSDSALGDVGGVVTLTGGTLSNYTGSYTNVTFSPARNFVLATNSTFDVGGTMTVNGSISGVGRLAKQASGTLVLNSPNTYAGGTLVNTGTIAYSNGGAFGTGSISPSATNGAATAASANTAFISYTGLSNVTLANNIALPTTLTSAFVYTVTQPGVAGASSASAQTVTYNGTISGGNSFSTLELNTQTGGDYASITAINGSNTYAGTTFLNRGSLFIGNASALGTSLLITNTNTNNLANAVPVDYGNVTFTAPMTFANGIQFNTASDSIYNSVANPVTLSGPLTGSAGLYKLGSGTLTVTGASNTYLGVTNVRVGTLVATGGDNRLGTVGALSVGDSTTNTPARVELNGVNQTVGGLATAGTAGAANAIVNTGATPSVLTANIVTGTQTFAGTLGGTGANNNAISLVKGGTGTQALTGTNTFTGGITVNQGTVSFNNDNALSTGPVTVGLTAGVATAGSANLPFLLSTTANTVASTRTVANNIVLPAPAAVSVYTISQTGIGVSATTATNASTLVLNGTITGGNANSTLEINTQTQSDYATMTVLNGSNTYAGSTVLIRGSLTLGNANAISNTKLILQTNPNSPANTNTGFVPTTYGNVNFAPSITTLPNDIQVNTAGNSINVPSGNVTLTGVVSGAAGFGKVGSGTLTLTGAGTNTGASTVFAGTLSLGNGTTGNDGTLAASGITVNGGATLLYNRFGPASAAYPISGSGAVVKSGGGAQTLTGTNTYSGLTTVNNGTLELAVAAQAPVLTSAGADIRNGRVIFDYTDTNPIFTIQGLLAASFLDPVTPGVMDSGQLKSTTSTAKRGLGYGDDGAGKVTVMATLFGDADLDGGVSINDFNALAGNFGKSGGQVWTGGDFDYDGGVSINDFNLLAGNFGQTLPASAELWSGLLAFAAANNDLAAFEAVTGVPEPTSLALLAAGATLGLRRRRR